MRSSPSNKAKRGFSLIELLVVMAVIALLAVAAGPAFNAISNSNGVGQGAYDIAGLLEFGRTEAATRQTYVWVGFQNVTNAGSPQIVAGAVFSKDGTTNTAATNLAGLTRVVRIKNVKLTNWNSIQSATKAYLNTNMPTPSSVARSSANGVSFSMGKTTFSDRQTVTFTPSGEALLSGAVDPDAGFDPCIDVSFVQVRGNIVPPNAEDASVILDGATGSVQILRIK